MLSPRARTMAHRVASWSYRPNHAREPCRPRHALAVDLIAAAARRGELHDVHRPRPRCRLVRRYQRRSAPRRASPAGTGCRRRQAPRSPGSACFSRRRWARARSSGPPLPPKAASYCALSASPGAATHGSGRRRVRGIARAEPHPADDTLQSIFQGPVHPAQLPVLPFQCLESPPVVAGLAGGRPRRPPGVRAFRVPVQLPGRRGPACVMPSPAVSHLDHRLFAFLRSQPSLLGLRRTCGRSPTMSKTVFLWAG